MHKTVLALALSLFTCFVEPAISWNRTGHMVVAYIAYSNLAPRAKQRVDALLRKHPDYMAWMEGVAFDEAERSRAAFLAASYWPDTIRNDPRFFNDGGEPTPTFAGFPEMGRHQMWHYIDRPLSTDGTPLPRQVPSPNALTQITLFRQSIGNPAVSEPIRAYQLAWMIHLVGDVHQPLHCVERYTAEHYDREKRKFFGDQGGNLVHVDGEKSLHLYWDNLLGETDTAEFAASAAADLMRSVKKESPANTNEREWIDEGFEIAKQTVYSFGGGGSERHPARLSAWYRATAASIGRTRAALAGYRLAALLNQILAD